MKKETYTPEEIRKRFDSLPADIKSIVFGADMLGLIQKMGEKYKLHIDQLDVLEAETADVMTGFSKPEDFVANLSTSLSIDRSQAENIAKDINEGLFLKIRESLKKLYAENKEPAVQMPSSITAVKVATPPPPAAPPKPIEAHPADLMLTQKTVTTAPVVPKPITPPPPAPQPYKADPYREPTT